MENIELFKNIKETDLDRILGCTGARSKIFQKGDSVLRMGEKVDKIGIVLVGELQISRTDLDGNKTLIDKISDNSVFAEALVCAGIKRSPVNIEAVKQTGVLFIPLKKALKTCENACEGHNMLIKNLLEIIARKNVFLNYRMDLIAKTTTREKVLSYLKCEAQKAGQKSFTIPFSREEMANFLCVDRSAMSRELSKLHKEGILSYRKNEFTFLK